MEFVVGQRWVSQAEAQLGLGMIVEIDGRHITITFPAVEEDRMYASADAPLARLVYKAGDTLVDLNDMPCVVKDVENMNGLYYYLACDENGQERLIPETQISGHIELSSPSQRLFSGQFDKNRQFQLRAATLHCRYQYQRSDVRGLLGTRTDLLPHQVYIAHEVASRFAPRVLLADEVGLGKTIEAGMILHHQLQTGLSNRVLIVVPEPLLHQWLVEMLRKFNLPFSLFDQNRYDALLEAGEVNPFETEQLVLCSLSLLTNNAQVSSHVQEADWDLLIVDEAHHLLWSEEQPSDEYLLIEKLAQICKGLLLLTATPEQVGIESHFARLRLLDPSRFYDLKKFIEEQSHFVELNSIVRDLSDNNTLSTEQEKHLQQFIGDDEVDLSEGNDLVIRQLLDRHGTGRVLFRNTRAAIKDFPARVPKAYALECKDDFTGDLAPKTELNVEVARDYLSPERLWTSGDWVNADPRVKWLEDLLKTLRNEKVLVICADANTALDLERYLHFNVGIRSAAFYEGLTIIERDRAAAYFADDESGAQALICSEIGSEGRNFQFAHHLVLFDLPINADLLEQRIGRLDRIGQKSDISIHIPYIKGTAQEVMYRWYHEGLQAFSHSFSAGQTVFEHFSEQLLPLLINAEVDQKAFDGLLKKTQDYVVSVKEELHNGRDQLLELNSCNQEQAAEIIENIKDSEKSELLKSYMTMMYDGFGVDHEFHSEGATVLHPTDHMLTGHFPGLKDEGTTVTYERERAQVREDMEFLSWEHPMVTESMELVLGSELGNVAIGMLNLKSIPVGTVLLETFYAVQCRAPKSLQIHRFLPSMPVRVLLDSQGKQLTDTIKHAQLNKLRKHLKRANRPAIIKQLQGDLENMLEQAKQIAEEKAAPLYSEAKEKVALALGEEIERLQHLKAMSNTVRAEEITFFEKQKEEALASLAHATVELQAVRVLVNA